jgi:hypothetical protein
MNAVKTTVTNGRLNAYKALLSSALAAPASSSGNVSGTLLVGSNLSRLDEADGRLALASIQEQTIHWPSDLASPTFDSFVSKSYRESPHISLDQLVPEPEKRISVTTSVPPSISNHSSLEHARLATNTDSKTRDALTDCVLRDWYDSLPKHSL